jgi:hypothetical protein
VKAKKPWEVPKEPTDLTSQPGDQQLQALQMTSKLLWWWRLLVAAFAAGSAHLHTPPSLPPSLWVQGRQGRTHSSCCRLQQQQGQPVQSILCVGS